MRTFNGTRELVVEIPDGPAMYGLTGDLPRPDPVPFKKRVLNRSRKIRHAVSRAYKSVLRSLWSVVRSAWSKWPFDSDDAKMVFAVLAVSTLVLWSAAIIGAAGGLVVRFFWLAASQ